MDKDTLNVNDRRIGIKNMAKNGLDAKADMPLVSIIIPAYNAEDHIKHCVDSVLEQSYENVEVICIDDGSIDKTPEILQFLTQKDNRVLFLKQEHLGVSAARNKGLANAKGKYICFVEADDHVEEESYEILVRNAEKENVDMIVYGSATEGEVPDWFTSQSPLKGGCYKNRKTINALFEKREARSLWTCFFKKELLDKNGIKFNENVSLGEDTLFLFELVPGTETILVIKDVIYHHRFGREGSLTYFYTKDIKSYYLAWLSLVEQLAKKWKDKGILEKAEDKFVTWLVSEGYRFIKNFPLEKQREAARLTVNIIKNNHLKYYCVDWYEKEHLTEIFALAEMDQNEKKIADHYSTKSVDINNKEPLVSVIVPTYNVEEYIKQCVDSLLDQTYKNIEVICIDDGSTDNTVPILKFMQEKDKRLILIQQEHSGVSAARNKGLENARGKYISFVDSDDFMQWNSYEILVSVAENNQLDLIIFGGNAVGDAPEWIQKKLNTRYKYYTKGTADKVIFEEESARPFLWLHFIKREIIEKGEKLRFNEAMEMGEDQLFQFEYVPRAESVMVLEDKLYNYRIARNCSLMQLYEKQKMKKFDSHILLISSVIESWKKSGLFQKNEDKLITWIVNLTYWALIFFPKAFQPELAKKVINLVNKYDIKDYFIAWYEKDHWLYMKDIAEKNFDKEEELREIREKADQEKFQIQEILKSRAFKLGRFTTPQKERLDISLFDIFLK